MFMSGRSAVKPAIPWRYTEYNVAQLGLISIQMELPAHARKGWTSEVIEGSNTAGIRCLTAHEAGVPHGIAGDVFSALVTETIAAQETGETRLQLTVADIARQAGLSARPADYVRITNALYQLRYSTYTIWNKWRTPLTNVKEEAAVTLLPTLDIRTEESRAFAGQIDTYYNLELHESVVDSITGTLTLAMNPEINNKLHSPTARGLYRLLEAWRRDPADLTRVSNQVTIRGTELAESARLLGARPAVSQLLRPLQRDRGAFEQLRAAGYLVGFDTVGRGDNLMLRFDLAEDGQLMDMQALEVLKRLGVRGKNAETLAMTFNRELVECASWLVAERKKSGYTVRSDAGLTIKLLNDGSAGLELDRFRNRNRPVAVRGAVRKAAKAEVHEPEPEPAVAATPEQAIRNLGTLVRMKRLSAAQASELQARVEDGRLDPNRVNELIMMTGERINEWLTANLV